MPYKKTNENPDIMIKGNKIHPKKITKPAKATKICRIIPVIIKTILIIAPRILENVLDINVLKNSIRLKPFG
jgi:hypothetical protein